jgi:sigma-B regulation protein RsbU (phosphoserine phosphatase)
MMQSKQNTAFLSVVLDPTCYKAVVANAGLIVPLLWRNGDVHYIESYGLPLGALQGARYTEQTVDLHPGDSLLLVSDGIVEAMNNADELWGFTRLEAAFRAVGGAEPTTQIEAILSQVHAFVGGAPQHDDMTVVALRVV